MPQITSTIRINSVSAAAVLAVAAAVLAAIMCEALASPMSVARELHGTPPGGNASIAFRKCAPEEAHKHKQGVSDRDTTELHKTTVIVKKAERTKERISTSINKRNLRIAILHGSGIGSATFTVKDGPFPEHAKLVFVNFGAIEGFAVKKGPNSVDLSIGHTSSHSENSVPFGVTFHRSKGRITIELPAAFLSTDAADLLVTWIDYFR